MFGRYDLIVDRGVNAGGFVAYDDDCFRTALILRDDYTKDRDYNGDFSVNFQFDLKTLSNFNSVRKYESWY